MSHFIPNQMHLNTLIENGLSRSDAINLLEITNNNLEKAFEMAFTTVAATPDPLQQAIEESRKTSNVAGTASNPINVGGLSKEEQELNAVIAASYKDAYAGGVDPSNMAMIQYENPNFRKRESDGISVGLKNIGNTCYLNSMIQTYFMIPEVRRAVLNFPYGRPIADDNPKKNAIKFTKELQRLFVYLIYSNQKWVDPSQLLKSLTDDHGKPVNVGNQEDASEFNELFLTTIHNAFQAVASEKEKEQNIDFVKKMFFGKFSESFTIFQPNSDKEKTTSSNEEEFNSLLLTVPDSNRVKGLAMQPDLHDLIDDSLVDEMDYKDEGQDTTAQKIKWFKALPQVVIFQQNRVRYDTETKNNEKINTAVTFDKEIYLDRYLEQNKEQTKERRVVVKKMKVELKSLKEELDSYLHHKGAAHGLHEALNSVIDDIEDQKKKETDQNECEMLEKLIQNLKNRHRNVQFTIKTLNEKIEELEKKIKTSYNDLDKTAYVLMSVWIHRGSPSTGHYWAYTQNFYTGKWIKFNDIRVSEEEENVVMREAVGGLSDTSAYFLFYIEKSMIERFDLNRSHPDINFKETIPQILLDEVEEDNKKFEKELQEYTKKAGDKFERFTNQYQETVKKAETDFKEHKDTPHSFYEFLLLCEKPDLMFAQVFCDTYKSIFERQVSDDIGSEGFEKAKKDIGEEVSSKAIQLALGDLPDLKSLKQQFEEYQVSNYLYALGLQYSLDKKYENAIKFLYSAHEMQKKVTNPLLKKEKHIKGALLVTIQLYFDSCLDFTPARTSEIVTGVTHCFSVARAVLPPDSAMLINMKKNFGELLKAAKQKDFYPLATLLVPTSPVKIPFDLEKVDLSSRSMDILARIPSMWKDLKEKPCFEEIWSSYV